jgi:5-methyltetrahydrofolate--homocysteine methyltransferase
MGYRMLQLKKLHDRMEVKELRGFLTQIQNRVLIYDGSKGYMLQKMGLTGGECPELWNVIHQDDVKKVYSLYKQAGSDVIQTNTFQGNRIQLEKYSLGDKTYELNFEGAKLAREVMGSEGFVAASIGPVGQLFEPSGELTFDVAYKVYAEQVKAVVDGGVDIINFETFTDIAELRAALLAAKETCSLPVICSVAFESNGRTLMGTDPYVAAAVLKSLGADMVGANCSFGPAHMLDIVKKMTEVGGVFMSVKPNAGLPEVIDGKVFYSESPEGFAELSGKFVEYGARLIGGCCGTTPEFIRAIKDKLERISTTGLPERRAADIITSSVKHIRAEELNDKKVGHLRVEKGEMETLDEKVLDISSQGYDAINIIVDHSADEDLLAEAVNIAQGFARQPFIIETKSPKALEKALRLYKGIAGVVVNNCDGRITGELLKVAKKYGSTVL